MARRTTAFTVDAEGRDKGKVFWLTEMSAAQAEKWAARALNAIMGSGVMVHDGIAKAGLAGVAAVGLEGFKGLPWAQAEPLLDEMFSCVQIIRDPSKISQAYPQGLPHTLREDDIEEVGTRLKLRMEVLDLHLGFSLAEKLRTSAASRVSEPASTTPTSEP